MIGRSLSFLTMVVALAVVLGIAAPSAYGITLVDGTFPYRDGETIEIVVPFAPGGGFDTYARLVAPHLERALGQIGGVRVNVIVRNNPAAGGQMAHLEVLNGRKNGTQLLILNGEAVQNFIALYDLPIDLNEYTYIGAFSEFVKGVGLSNRVPAYTFEELVAYSRQHTLRVATSGVGASPHIDPLLMRELLAQEGIELNIRFVHYEGTGPAMAAMRRGEVEMLISAVQTQRELFDDGDARLFVVLGPNRVPRYPHAPTLAEMGVPRADEIVAAMWGSHVLAGPRGMVETARDVLRTALLLAVNSVDFHNDVNRAGLEVRYLSPDDVKAKVVGKLPIIASYRPLLSQALGL